MAKDFVDGVTFSVSSIEEYAHELKELGLEGDQEVMAALFDKEGKKYSMTDKFRWSKAMFNETVAAAID